MHADLNCDSAWAEAFTGAPVATAATGSDAGRDDSAPGKQPALQERQQQAEQERGEADGDDAGVHALEIQHLARRLHHVAHAFARVHHFGQNHVGPADVVQNAERAEDGGKEARNISHRMLRRLAPSVQAVSSRLSSTRLTSSTTTASR